MIAPGARGPSASVSDWMGDVVVKCTSLPPKTLYCEGLQRIEKLPEGLTMASFEISASYPLRGCRTHSLV